MNLQDLKDDPNWGDAFACAMRDDIRLVPGYDGSAAPFGVGDVEEVIATSEGQNDGESWVGVFRLSDGRFAFVSAWCDYTGWGCQDGGLARLASTLDDLKRLGVDDAARARLFPDDPAL